MYFEVIFPGAILVISGLALGTGDPNRSVITPAILSVINGGLLILLPWLEWLPGPAVSLLSVYWVGAAAVALWSSFRGLSRKREISFWNILGILLMVIGVGLTIWIFWRGASTGVA